MLEFLYVSMISSIIVLVIAMAVLIKSADYFTDIAEKIGHVLGIPQIIIGITIVSIGTSIPEIATSLFAVFKGSTEFVLGNAIGSNITNIFLVIGVAAILVKGLNVKRELVRVDVPVLLGSALMILFLVLDGVFSFYDAVFTIILYGVYIFYISREHFDHQVFKDKFKWAWFFGLLLSVFGIYFGAKFTVDSVNALTVFFGLPDTSVIAITIVALGTSLPELTVSVVAAFKKNFDISVGNIIGSNIFNSFMVLGIPGLFMNLSTSPVIFDVGLPLMILATVLVSVGALKKKISRIEGIFYLILYGLFLYLSYVL